MADESRLIYEFAFSVRFDYVSGHMSILDRMCTVRTTVWVYTFTVQSYAYGLTPLLRICRSCCLYLQMVQIKGEHNV